MCGGLVTPPTTTNHRLLPRQQVTAPQGRVIHTRPIIMLLLFSLHGREYSIVSYSIVSYSIVSLDNWDWARGWDRLKFSGER